MEETKGKDIKWTKGRCAEEAKKYPSRRKFQKGCQSAYQKAYKMDWLDEICKHMEAPIKPSGYWTKARCAKEAKKHKTRFAFQKANPTAYHKAIRKGWLEEICAHMVVIKKARTYWTKEKCHAEALKYKTRKEFSKGCCSAYNKAAVYEWLDEICSHMIPQRKNIDDWTLQECVAEAQSYRTRSEFKVKCSGAYNKALKENWLDTICSHMNSRIMKWTKKRCHEEAKNYKTRAEFVKHRPTAYNIAKDKGWLDSICKHMKARNVKWTMEKCAEIAKEYDSRSVFAKTQPNAYSAARRNGWLEEICSHMLPTQRKAKSLVEEIKLSELEVWLIDYITSYIHSLKTENNMKFNQWAVEFKREEVASLVEMEFYVDWGCEKRRAIPASEAVAYADSLIQRILDVWFL